MNRIRAIGELCAEIIFPVKCAACNRTMKMQSYKALLGDERQDALCKECRKKVKYIKEPVCLKCGKQTGGFEEEYCADCAASKHVFDRGVAVFNRDEIIAKALYGLKYKGYSCYGEFFGSEIAKNCGQQITEWSPDVIIPVPIHRDRRKKRGYNQAELMAKRVSELTGIPMDVCALQRIKNTKPQKELGKELRKKNIENAFKTNKNMVKYKKVMLIDDIYTTGCTIDACAASLKQAGVEAVYFIAVCIGTGI